MKYGIVDEEGAFLKKSAMDTRASEGGEAIAAKVENIVEKLRKDGVPEGIYSRDGGYRGGENTVFGATDSGIYRYALEETSGGPVPGSLRSGK